MRKGQLIVEYEINEVNKTRETITYCAGSFIACVCTLPFLIIGMRYKIYGLFYGSWSVILYNEVYWLLSPLLLHGDGYEVMVLNGINPLIFFVFFLLLFISLFLTYISMTILMYSNDSRT